VASKSRREEKNAEKGKNIRKSFFPEHKKQE